MADYEIKFVAKYQVTQRNYRLHRVEKYEEKEFKTKWEAEKFLQEWREKHWFAHGGSVRQVIIDKRCPMEKAIAERAFDAVDRAMRNFH